MSTIGWFLILAGILVIRQVAKGRVLNTMEDLSDAFLAIATGDTQALTGVVTRTGDYNQPSLSEQVDAGVAPAGKIAGNTVLAAAVALGSKAKGYRWTATGPTYYDCSGLVWRAVQRCGYTGPRFTTADVDRRKGFSVVDTPQVGDIVLWHAGSGHATGHMGIVSGGDQFYSARSVRSGIGYAKISSFRNDAPKYLRFMAVSESAKRSAIAKQIAS